MKSLRIYYLNRCKEYRKNLGALVHASRQEDIHNLRLVVKKLRALYHLAASHDPHLDFDLHFSSLTEVFKAAEKLRDIDITRKCLSKLLRQDVAPARIKKLSASLLKQRNAYALKLKKMAETILSIENLYDSDIFRSLEEIRLPKIKKYLAFVLAQIANKREKKMDAGRLHGVRKLAKEHLYLSRAGGKRIIQLTANNLRNLEPMQKQIGKWHDYDIAVNAVEIFTKEPEILKALNKRKRRLKKRAMKELKKYPLL
jgi:CHAD domain-containing protein